MSTISESASGPELPSESDALESRIALEPGEVNSEWAPFVAVAPLLGFAAAFVVGTEECTEEDYRKYDLDPDGYVADKWHPDIEPGTAIKWHRILIGTHPDWTANHAWLALLSERTAERLRSLAEADEPDERLCGLWYALINNPVFPRGMASVFGVALPDGEVDILHLGEWLSLKPSPKDLFRSVISRSPGGSDWQTMQRLSAYAAAQWARGRPHILQQKLSY